MRLKLSHEISVEELVAESYKLLLWKIHDSLNLMIECSSLYFRQQPINDTMAYLVWSSEKRLHLF